MTGFYECKGSSCGDSAKGYDGLTSYFYPNVSGTSVVPRSNLVVIRKRGSVETTAVLQLVPDSSREHFYLIVDDLFIVKPVLPRTCSGIGMQATYPSKFQLHQTEVIFLAVFMNSGRVSTN